MLNDKARVVLKKMRDVGDFVRRETLNDIIAPSVSGIKPSDSFYVARNKLRALENQHNEGKKELTTILAAMTKARLVDDDNEKSAQKRRYKITDKGVSELEKDGRGE